MLIKKARILLSSCLWLITFGIQGQHYLELTGKLNTYDDEIYTQFHETDNEVSKKLAYDFKSVWAGELSEVQQKKIMNISIAMNKKRYKTSPYHTHFLGAITYAIQDKGISGTRLDNILQATEESVQKFNGKEMANYLAGLNFFFARSYLYKSRFTNVKIANPDEMKFDFEVINDEEVEEPVTEEEPISEEIPENDFEESDWGENDDWGDENWESFDTEDTESELVPEVSPNEYVAILEGQDTPIAEGPVLNLSNADIQLSTPYDTILLKRTKGKLILKESIYIVDTASYQWPEYIKHAAGAKVYMSSFFFDIKKPHVKSCNASLQFQKYFDGLEYGCFETHLHTQKIGKRVFPRFTTHVGDIHLKSFPEQVKYKGGFAIVGDEFYGMSLDNKKGDLFIDTDNGQRFVAESRKFHFYDSTIKAQAAEIKIYHDADSITHPQAKLEFNSGNNELTIIKDRYDFRHTPYRSSYFKTDFNADVIKWDMDSDSLDISILNAKDLIPAVFTSQDFYADGKFKKYQGLYDFNPIGSVVRYARRRQTNTYLLSDMVSQLKLDYRQALAAVRFLFYNGFVRYNEDTEEVTVERKAYHYILSKTRKKDYDNILFSSKVKGGEPNATLHFDSREIELRGVKLIYMSTDEKLFVEPDSGIVRLRKNRDFTFNGSTKAGDFKYSGKNFHFDYDKYEFDLTQIDSMNIIIMVKDSSNTEDAEKVTLSNHLTDTKGTLFLHEPGNKSGAKKDSKFPYFVSGGEATVLFDNDEILDGAYGQGMKFVAPPFEMDSTNRDDFHSIGFDGTFDSDGILPPFKEKLVIMPDQSLGFTHTIPKAGYRLYGGQGQLYNEVKLDNGGLRANGKVDYITTSINSSEFILYPDSVIAAGTGGEIREGVINGISYPEAKLDNYRMTWLPKKDSMYVKNIGDPFKFYNETATLDGEANITASGLFGSGKLLTRGSKAISNEMQFKKDSYSAHHAKFEVLTDDPQKPAMAGDDIVLHFDLKGGVADVHPEKEGVAAIDFPYAKMKTSITNAIWYLEDSIITMSKPEGVALENSYFYSTRRELDSLAFNADQATYDINTQELEITGIPYIKVSDAKIIPPGNKITILGDSELRTMSDVQIILDTLTGYHYLHSGEIKILSRKSFIGKAFYQFVNAQKDTFDIEFLSFNLERVHRGESYSVMTVCRGSVTQSEDFLVYPGFYYKGDVTMLADKKALELEGEVKLDLYGEDYDYWIKYKHDSSEQFVSLDFDNGFDADNKKINAGIFMNNDDLSLFTSFFNNDDLFSAHQFFKPSGMLSYNREKKQYLIETATKTKGETYFGQTLVFDKKSKGMLFEGSVSFVEKNPHFKILGAASGSSLGNGKTKCDAIMGFDFDIQGQVINEMAFDMLDIIERLGSKPVNGINIGFLSRLSSLIGEEATRYYEEKFLKDYIPLTDVSKRLQLPIVLTKLKLEWSEENSAWYNIGKLGLSNVGNIDINAEIDGFVEVKKTYEGTEKTSLFLQIGPATWYYFSYLDGTLTVRSSNQLFNELVTKKSKALKAGFGSYATIVGEKTEVADFVDTFRSDYYNIDDPYAFQADDDMLSDDDDDYGTFEEEEDEEDLFDTDTDTEDDFEDIPEDKEEDLGF